MRTGLKCVNVTILDEEGRQMATKGCMRKMRRSRWEDDQKWDGDDMDRLFRGGEMLHEDVQDQSSPRVVIGTDVVNLYPSLDIAKVVGTVRRAVLNSKITWEEVDYLEAARYIALNWYFKAAGGE